MESPDTVDNPAPGAEPFPALVAKQIQQAWAARPADYVPRTRHLDADGQPLYTNRLFLDASPYLRQHAHNPVDWHPWGDEAFEIAASLGRPVFLSVGYSTCHWCHVMEEESFEDPEIARYINEHFVAIKVDREERPDVDAVYMAAVQALTGSGGWPMTVFLTPDRVPFYGGTYFPPRDGGRGRGPGLLGLLKVMSQAYLTQPEKVADAAKKLADHLKIALAPDMGGDLPGAATLDRTAAHLAQRYDAVEGGLQGAPKFPSSLPIRFLLRQYLRTGDSEPLEMATHTLRQMAAGGIHDQLGGGFHRYSTDQYWLVPHFEKMLYDNALLSLAYTEAWQVTDQSEFADVTRDILDYVAREMSAPEGGFYSATDADSLVPGTGKREEGWFFTWTPDEVRAVLDAPHARAVIAWYGITDSGNFEGRNVLHTTDSVAKVAASLGIKQGRLKTLITQSRPALLKARALRPPPLRDDKILAGWNGLMISAFARAAIALDEPAYARRAEAAASYVLGPMRTKGRLHRAAMDGKVQHDAMIEDYAFMVAGLIDLFEATGDRRWLTQAIALDGVVQAHYEDPVNGGWYRTPDDGPPLLAREKVTHDGAQPAGSSVHALNLFRLAELTTRDEYRVRAERALKASAQAIEQGAMTEALLAVDWHLDKPKEIVLVTPQDRSQAAPLLGVVRRSGLRNRVLVVASEGELASLAQTVPLVEGKTAISGQATAYVCEQGVCQRPTTDLAVFKKLLDER
ncbi:MAG: thioredoxin domain-containing protein [Oligoflexia bacterium]|nr:thioredoxin domain-containing protein [Oligoflexia bacterium]